MEINQWTYKADRLRLPQKDQHIKVADRSPEQIMTNWSTLESTYHSLLP